LSLCRNQVMAFFRDLDEGSYDTLVARLAPDAVWHRQGKVLTGRDQARTALQQRSPTRRINHLITNLVADDFSDTRCLMRGYMLVISHDSGAPLSGPAPLTGIENIRTTQIELTRGAGNWLIARMSNSDLSFAIPA
jgi:hypothetical protein